MWVNFSGTQGRPSNGKGGLNSTAGASFTPATVFTRTTVASLVANSLAATGNLVVGAVVAATDGAGGCFWGIVTAIGLTVDTLSDLVTVDRWRVWGQAGAEGTPTNGADLFVVPAFFGMKQEEWIIDWIALKTTDATLRTITIQDLFGNTQFQISAQVSSNPFVLTFPCDKVQAGVNGLGPMGPVQVITSNAAALAAIGFRWL